MKTRTRVMGLIAFVFLLPIGIQGQSTNFTYQGKLSDGGNPANGNYDLQFALFDASAAGSQIGSTLTRSSTAVAAGIFTVPLDFGVNAFPGANRFLQISVRPAGSGSFTILTPRQQINSTPYAIRTLSAATSDTATNSNQLGGKPANQYVQTNDSRLSDSRSPTAGSGNYIQNSTTQQAANFNISGNGSIGGNFGVGTAAPGSGLEVRGTGFNAQQRITDTTSGNSLVLQSGPSNSMKVTGYNYNTNAPVPLYLGVDGANTFLNTGGGRVGIGTSNPTFTLHASGNFHTRLGLTSTTGLGSSSVVYQTDFSEWIAGAAGSSDSTLANKFFIHKVGAGGTHLVINMFGDVGIGTVSPARLLHVNGRARIGSIPIEAATANVCMNDFGDVLRCGASSLRLKTNVAKFSSGLDVVSRLNPISFDWKDGSGHDIGLGAEDVAQIAPSLVFTNASGEVSGVKYERLNILLINAVNEQQKQINQMRSENAQLKARLRSVEKRLRSKR